MKPIAIHNGSGWNAKWIEYCRVYSIPYKGVNCFDSDVINQIRDCSGLMWQFTHFVPKDLLAARNVLNAAELMGLKVYPNFHANWHFDDKVSQKYLFEALDLPVVPAWTFFDLDSALEFAGTCELPIVAKLRRGAGSCNVRLLKNRNQVQRYAKRMFGKGFSPVPSPLVDAKTKFKIAAKTGGAKGVFQRMKKAPNFVRAMLKAKKYFRNENSYVYFQKFIPENICDLRITVVGNRAWGFRRIARKNDFRASGSGVIDYDVSKIPLEIIKQSFEAVIKLQMPSVCFDWIRDLDREYHFVEISYTFVDEAVYNCDGFWDSEMRWHEEHLYPSIAIIEDFHKICSER